MGYTPDQEPDADRWVDDVLDPARRHTLAPEDAALAEVLASMTAEPTEEDLVGFDAALAAFTAAGSEGAATPVAAPSRWRRLLAAPAAAVAAAATVVVTGGMAAAAYNGALPDPLQELAHRTIGAPAVGHPRPTATPAAPETSGAPSTTAPGPTTTPTAPPSAAVTPGPAATGPAAIGLCQAFLRGGVSPGSAAYHSLEVAAGSDSITVYCNGVVHPSPTSSDGRSHPTHTPPAPRTPTPTTAPPTHPVGPPGGSPTPPLPRF